MSYGYRKQFSYVPLLAVAVLACAVFVGSLIWGAHRIDVAEQRREEVLISQEIPREIAVVEQRLNAFTLWDEALRKLEGPVDVAWADTNIRSLTHNDRQPRVVLLDQDDRIAYAGQDAGPVPADTAAALASLAGPTVRDVRRREGGRVPPPVNDPVRGHTIGLIHGQPAIVIAALVRSDTGKIRPLAKRAPILIMQAQVDSNLRRTFARRFLLADLETAVVEGPPVADKVEVSLARLSGGQRIVLRWTPQEPGFLLLKRSAVFLAIAALGVAVAGIAVVLHTRGVTRRLVASQAEAEWLAHRDPLTGLANRLLFADRLRKACEQLRRGNQVLGLLCLDLDRFKDVNDMFGHEAGDELIHEVGRRLKALCRAEDTVARLGGDEFAIIARSSAATGAAELAQRVVLALFGPVQLASTQVDLSCSVGVTIITDAAVTQAEALRQADLALYRSKQGGRGRFSFFEPEMDAAIKGRKALEADLRESVQAAAITVAYQPIVDARGRACGLEALARWNHPIRGEVTPSIFIAAAENCGLIDQLAAHVVRHVCHDSRRWPDLTISFNLSPTQFKRPNLVETLAAQLERAHVDAARFNIEITENILMADDLRTRDTLAGLGQLGFGLVLDDFGTGYSSLSYLDRYPVKKIKIDRSFVERLTKFRSTRTIVTAVLQMAEGLDLGVVAEGVETLEQFELLRDIGCKEFQGFLFSRPMPAEAISKVIEMLSKQVPPGAGALRADRDVRLPTQT